MVSSYAIFHLCMRCVCGYSFLMLEIVWSWSSEIVSNLNRSIIYVYEHKV
jgi:hypothetical protein